MSHMGVKVGHSTPSMRCPDCLPQADLRTSSPLVLRSANRVGSAISALRPLIPQS